MSDFVLVDLDSQGDAVAEYVKGWMPEDVISWLEMFGTVSKHGSDEHARYSHLSNCGRRGYFYFTEDGDFVIWRSGWLYC
jgi:hypothetical protein